MSHQKNSGSPSPRFLPLPVNVAFSKLLEESVLAAIQKYVLLSCIRYVSKNKCKTALPGWEGLWNDFSTGILSAKKDLKAAPVLKLKASFCLL